MFDIDGNFLIVLIVYLVLLIAMRLYGFQKSLDKFDYYWRKALHGRSARKDEYELSNHQRDCLMIHRAAKREEEVWGMVVTGEYSTHLEYCKRYKEFLPELACKHEDRQLDMSLDGSVLAVCRDCGKTEWLKKGA